MFMFARYIFAAFSFPPTFSSSCHFAFWFSFYSYQVRNFSAYLFFSPSFIAFAPLIYSYWFFLRTTDFNFFSSFPLCQSRSYLHLAKSSVLPANVYLFQFTFTRP